MAAAVLGVTSLGAASASAAAEVVPIAMAASGQSVAPRPDMSAQSALAWYVNNYRKAVGVRPATTSYALQVAAWNHAKDMARMNRMTHTGSNGSNGGQRISAAGFRWSAWAENIAVGQTSSTAVFNAWRYSPGHRANMLNPAFTHLGVGLAYGNGRYWWASCSPAASAPSGSPTRRPWQPPVRRGPDRRGRGGA